MRSKTQQTELFAEETWRQTFTRLPMILRLNLVA
jgi:hypothetical protein